MDNKNKISEKIKYFTKLSMEKEKSGLISRPMIDYSAVNNLSNTNIEAKKLEEKKIKQNFDKNLAKENLPDKNSQTILNGPLPCPIAQLKKESIKNNLIKNQEKYKQFLLHLCNPLSMLKVQNESLCIKIANRIYLTEGFSNENERVAKEDKMIEYFDKKFKRYVVYIFTRQEKSKYKNVQFFPEPEINFNLIILLCKSIYGWLTDDDCVVIIERSGQLINFYFILLCVINFIEPNDKWLNVLVDKFKIPGIKGILNRHLVNFNRILSDKLETKKNQLLFYQFIFSTKVGKLDSFCKSNFKLKIANNKNVHEFYSEMEPNYKDDFYLIFFLNELPIIGDVKLLLYVKDCVILEMNFNTFFYEMGIFRCEESEIEYLKKDKNVQIWVDMAFKENKTVKHKMPYFIQTNYIESLQIICDHFKRNVNINELNELSEKYNKTFAKFILLQKISLVNLEEYVESVSKKIERNILMNPMYIKNKIPYIEKDPIEQLKNSLEILEVKNKEEVEDISKLQYFNSNEEYHNETLEILPEVKYEEETNKLKLPHKRPPSAVKKKESEVPTLFARRPLHLTCMKSSSSIFNDLSELNVKYDIDKFEEWFCDPVLKKEEKFHIKEKISLIDRNTFFLAQLAVKNLEKKQINYLEIESVLLNNFMKLELEDLNNIKRLFLKENDLINLPEYSLDEIDLLEREMINLSKNTFLRDVLFILLFDKKLTDELLIHKKLLQTYFISFSNLLENKTLKQILKLTLELSNALNFKYTLNKKKVISFRMSSLKSLQSYKGKSNDQNLLLFLVDQLIYKKEEVIKELNKFNDIQTLIEVDLKEIRERINDLTRDHKESVDKLNKMENDYSIYKYLSKVLGYGYKSLKEISEQFIKVELLSIKVTGKFCDTKDENINLVLKDLNIFFKEVKNELLKNKQ